MPQAPEIAFIVTTIGIRRVHRQTGRLRLMAHQTVSHQVPIKSKQLTACLELFQKEDIVFETVDTIDNSLWEACEVSDGIRLMVKSHQRKWEHAEANKRA